MGLVTSSEDRVSQPQGRVTSTDGRLLGIELEPDRSSQAAHNLARAVLQDRVELRVEDAAEILRRSSDAEWDLIFLDAERPAYPGYWSDLRRTLRPGGLLVVDNVISHADQVRDFRALVAETPGSRKRSFQQARARFSSSETPPIEHCSRSAFTQR